jgi:ParB-like chromosome segregation protein Spo0J
VSHAELVEGLGLASDVVVVPVSSLRAGSPHRGNGICAEQVEQLMALGGAWPPILVSREDGHVVDGAHRVAAARRLGLARLEAEYFDGTPEEAFIEFVRRNVAHGLSLTLAERKQAAERVLRAHPIWSDRRVAELCALSPKTVGRLRTGCPSASAPHSDTEVREGRDRRVRPARPGSARARVLEALRENPDGSLRAVAAIAGVSPETVRLVRLNLVRAPAPTAPADRPAGPTIDEVEDDDAAPTEWHDDAALASSDQGEAFLAWFEQTAVGEPDLAWVDAVPLGRVYVVADEARRRSEAWLELARALEARPGRAR